MNASGVNISGTLENQKCPCVAQNANLRTGDEKRMRKKSDKYWKSWKNVKLEFVKILKINKGVWPRYAAKKYYNLYVALHRYHKGSESLKKLLGNTKRQASALEERISIPIKKWSPSLSYLIGLIVTDGTISKNMVRIKLAEKDKQVLFNLHKWLNLKNKICIHPIGKPSVYKNIHIIPKQRSFALSIHSKRLVEICKNSGVSIKNKTYTQESLKVSKELFSHCLRGMIDGDGGIYINKNKSRNGYLSLSISLNGREDFLNYVAKMVYSLLRIKGSFSNKSSPHTKELRWGGKNAIKLGHFIYKNSSKNFYLDRKKKVFLNLLTLKNNGFNHESSGGTQ